MMLDVAGGSFDKDRCQWGTVEKFLDDLGAPTTAANARYIALTGGLFRPQTTQDLRMKIVKPPHTWDTEGYLGNLTNESINGGVFWEWIGDREGDEFILAPVEIGRDIASVDVRFWLENDYCRSGGQGTHSTNAVRVRAAMDQVIPGPVQNLTVTGANGEFVAKWKDPLVGAATIDDVAIQYATDASFTTGVNTSQDWGDVNTLKGTDPGKTYYWRVAVHNLSDQDSDPSTAATLGATGWGPWTAYGAPTAVSSGSGAGLPSDSVIPGPVQNLTVTGANGEYVADWDDPATGNLTLDDIAIQYATDSSFTFVAGTPAGWGNVTHLQSTSPGTTYYFRVAAHNQSGQPSHASTSGWLGPTGWGPWTAYGAPTPVSSGGPPNAPVNSVIPGPVQSLSVTGNNGKFLATWADPATGFETIDDVAIQFTTDAGFTVNGPGSPAKGWGPRNLLESTAPEQSYYFRVAVHNTSGQPSHASTLSILGPTGWGPWTNAPGNPVYSGVIPLNPAQTSEQLVYNGGFEIGRSGGFPDGWEFYEGVLGTGTWGLNSIHNEGNLGVQLTNGPDASGQYGIMSRSFAVRPGEQLLASMWARSSGTGAQGIYFRMVFHSSDPDFTSKESYVDIVTAAPLPFDENFRKFEGQFTVPPGMYWCRATLYNYWQVQISVNYHFDDVQVLRVISGKEIGDGTIPPDRFTGSARTQFVETFEDGLADFWKNEGPGTFQILDNQGIDGGKVLRCLGKCGLLTYYTDAGAPDRKLMIPYDPRKLYRMTVRMRGIAWQNAPTSLMHAGILTFDNNRIQTGVIFPALYNYTGYGQWSLGVWYELTGFFKGTAATAILGPNPDPTSPGVPVNGTSYISPVVYVNYSDAATTAGDITDIDDIRIDVLEEEQYTTKAPNGTLSNLTLRTYYQQNDPISSTVSLYWSYTQGLVKADQFVLQINDGNANWVQRVKAPAGSSGPWEFAIYRLNANRQYIVSIAAEAIGAAGVVAQVGSNWPPFTPNANSGTTPGGVVNNGYLDWAGGNVWYDSLQYRNNYPPTNGISATINITNYQHGSGGSLVTITNITYNQGANIATHVAVLLRTPQGTITLNTDMVVSVMGFPLPSSYTVPMNLPNDTTFTVAVAALAECKNGRIYNTSYQQKNIPAGFPWIHGNSAPVGNQFVRLGHPSGSDYIQLYQPMRMYSPNAYLPSYSEGGTYQGGFSGDANGMYMANGNGKYFFVAQGGTPNFGFNLTNWGGSSGGCLAIAYGNAPPSAPSGGGVIWVDGFGAQFVSEGNTRTTFGAAGPHCAKCGYDFWKVASENPTWGASLYICGWCGAIYKSGPKSVLRKLTKEQRSEIIQVQNVETEKPGRLVRRRDTRRKRKRAKNRVRSPGRRTLRIRHKNRTV
jgi:hypothetical protein